MTGLTLSVFSFLIPVAVMKIADLGSGAGHTWQEESSEEGFSERGFLRQSGPRSGPSGEELRSRSAREDRRAFLRSVFWKVLFGAWPFGRSYEEAKVRQTGHTSYFSHWLRAYFGTDYVVAVDLAAKDSGEKGGRSENLVLIGTGKEAEEKAEALMLSPGSGVSSWLRVSAFSEDEAVAYWADAVEQNETRMNVFYRGDDWIERGMASREANF